MKVTWRQVFIGWFILFAVIVAAMLWATGMC